MAERNSTRKVTCVNEVRAFLLQAADRLLTLDTATTSANQSTTGNPSINVIACQSPNYQSPILPLPAATAATPSIPSVSPMVEQRRLFGFGQRSQSRPPAASKPNKKKKIPSCTLKFLCLASKDCQRPPMSVRERTELANIGLGDKSITFSQNGESVYGVLLEKYPQLSTAGGFDLLLYQRCGGNDTGFHTIHPPHTPSRLKDLCGQAKIYIRPLQQSINQSDPVSVTSVSQEVPADIPLLECFTCGELIQMNEMGEHQQQHNKSASCETTRVTTDKRQTTLDETITTESESHSSSICYEEIQPAVAEVQSTHNVVMLQDLCPDATTAKIQDALSTSSGDINVAAEQLLLSGDLPTYVNANDDESSDDLQLLTPVFDDSIIPVPTSPRDALMRFRQRNVDEEGTQRFFVSRMDGLSEMRRDIICLYKNPQTKLRVQPKVRFEDESAVGDGPVREFLSNAIKIIEEGIPSSTSKHLIFLEGEKDHRLPLHDQSLRLTGAFKALGRMIGHSILYGGPGLHGLAPAAKHYITSNEENKIEDGSHISLQDVPDYDLRQLITKLEEIPCNGIIEAEFRCDLEPYLYEAGMDPDKLQEHPKMIAHGLIIFQVLEKRHLELDDLATGMDAVSLTSFLKQNHILTSIVFPMEADRFIPATEVVTQISFEGKDSSENTKRTAEFFNQYINEMDNRKDDYKQMVDLLSFWTGCSSIRQEKGNLIVAFDGGVNVLPLSQTCFNKIILPEKYNDYEVFKKNIDIALVYGSNGFEFT